MARKGDGASGDVTKLSFVIHRPPQAVEFTIFLHENLVEMPTPLGPRLQPFYPSRACWILPSRSTRTSREIGAYPPLDLLDIAATVE